ncbi:MAG: hypothetical protein QM490_04140 [Candidatus Gracilibacteria bacterium]
MNTNTYGGHNTTFEISNTQLEKKFDQYNTLENDKHDIRKIFQIADDKRKLEMIKYIDGILLKFNEIHKDVIERQVKAINKGVKEILTNLSTLRNDDEVVDVLAELD